MLQAPQPTTNTQQTTNTEAAQAAQVAQVAQATTNDEDEAEFRRWIHFTLNLETCLLKMLGMI